MLAHFLALAVGLGSIAIYMAAFFFPEIHRKNDFIWSGVGFFYALVLWVFAQRITGGLLLGHVASVALLGWLGGQTLVLRRQVIPKAQQTPIPGEMVAAGNTQEQITKLSPQTRLAKFQSSITGLFAGTKPPVEPKAPAEDNSANVAAIIDAVTEATEPMEMEEMITQSPENPEVVTTTPDMQVFVSSSKTVLQSPNTALMGETEDVTDVPEAQPVAETAPDVVETTPIPPTNPTDSETSSHG
ncbi:Ycf66 family protein [Calothrix sp. 336/3]|uniref:Ycf66 family protein n=1 Tax=Calothrix sp. 336/3 TaxID=1337936 RepID=UPI000624B855|nr:Ycf66 family protein [Calothrix sp. 336/3]AKG20741.1 hypothetical protein IJ00_04940 [Calothrix sp. 336/3]